MLVLEELRPAPGSPGAPLPNLQQTKISSTSWISRPSGPDRGANKAGEDGRSLQVALHPGMPRSAGVTHVGTSCLFACRRRSSASTKWNLSAEPIAG